MPVIIWATGKAIYEDHEYFVGTVKNLHASIRQNAETSSGIQKGLEGQISDWKAKCAGFESANGVLTNQNRDQQNTINNCQSKALQLLVPAPLHIETIKIGEVPDLNRETVQYLFLTNKNISPVRVLVKCNQDIEKIAVGPVITPFVMASPKAQFKSHRIFEKSFDSPAWTPNAPLVANVTFDAPHGECSATSE